MVRGMVGVVGELVARVDAALDELFALDPATISQEEIASFVMESHRLRARAEAAATAAVGAFERHGDPETALNSASWIARRCRVRKGQAQREASNAKALRTMPLVAAAFEAGEISEQHVAELA